MPADNLPSSLWSFRGLWDRYAPPNSIAAFERSYQKGFPAVMDCKQAILDFSQLKERLAALPRRDSDISLLLLDPTSEELQTAVDCWRQSKLYVGTSTTSDQIWHVAHYGINSDCHLEVIYVSCKVALTELIGKTPAPDLIFWEAMNCRFPYRHSFHEEDDIREQTIRHAFGERPQLVRVSDFAEMDVLHALETGSGQ